MGEDRVAVLLFYHTLCLIHVSKHFTNCPLHELFHFHATQFWVTLLYTRLRPAYTGQLPVDLLLATS